MNRAATPAQPRGAGSGPARSYNRRALGQRGIQLAWVVMAALLGTTSIARAEPLVSIDPAPDGTLILVGSGWRPGSRMVVSVGRDQFPAQADAVGDFEIQTGLVSTGSPPELLAVHRPDADSPDTMAAPQPQPDTAHSFAVLFAQSVMMGAAFLALSGSCLGLVALGTRYLHIKRSARGPALSLSLKKP